MPVFIWDPDSEGERAPGGASRRWLDFALAKLEKGFLHKPWRAPATVIADADVSLGRSYPHPLVDHIQARSRALEIFKQVREKAD